MRSKKGMDISINLIIIAIIALIVMIIVIMIFTGKMGQARKSMNSTESQYSPDKCKVPGSGRTCCFKGDVPTPQGGWSDCFGQECCS